MLLKEGRPCVVIVSSPQVPRTIKVQKEHSSAPANSKLRSEPTTCQLYLRIPDNRWMIGKVGAMGLNSDVNLNHLSCKSCKCASHNNNIDVVLSSNVLVAFAAPASSSLKTRSWLCLVLSNCGGWFEKPFSLALKATLMHRWKSDGNSRGSRWKLWVVGGSDLITIIRGFRSLASANTNENMAFLRHPLPLPRFRLDLLRIAFDIILLRFPHFLGLQMQR